MDTAVLYINGYEFYHGTTAKRQHLKDGWCNFRKLGDQLAKEVFGRDFRIGRIWYGTSIVPESSTRSFHERKRQTMWLDALRQVVAPEIVYEEKWTAHDILATESGPRSRVDSPYVIHISAGKTRMSLPIKEVALALPPECSIPADLSGYTQVVQIRCPILADSRLPDRIDGASSPCTWDAYDSSKRESEDVLGWCGELDSLLSGLFENACKRHGETLPTFVERELQSRVHRCLADRHDSDTDFAHATFITKRLLHLVRTRRIVQESAPTVSSRRPRIRVSLPTWSELIRALERAGFRSCPGDGSHRTMRHPDGRRAGVTFHPQTVVPRGSFERILDDCQFTHEEFAEWL